MNKLLSMVVFVLTLAACGGGGDGGSPPPTTTSIVTNRIGSYTLSSITDDMTNTSTNVRQVVTATPSSNPPFTGTLKIGIASWNKVLNTGDATVGTVSAVGTYRLTATTNTYGAFLIENMAGTAGKVGIYTITSPYELTMDYEAENVNTGGITYRVISTEKWQKISDTP